MIVKMQRPLNGMVGTKLSENDADLVQVYNQSRSYVAHFHLKHLRSWFPDTEPKVYCKARQSRVSGLEPVDIGAAVNLSLQSGAVTTSEETTAKRLVIIKLVPDQPW